MTIQPDIDHTEARIEAAIAAYEDAAHAHIDALRAMDEQREAGLQLESRLLEEQMSLWMPKWRTALPDRDPSVLLRLTLAINPEVHAATQRNIELTVAANTTRAHEALAKARLDALLHVVAMRRA